MKTARYSPYHLSKTKWRVSGPSAAQHSSNAPPPPISSPIDYTFVFDTAGNDADIDDDHKNGQAPAKGRPVKFPKEQATYLLDQVPTYLKIPTNRKNDLGVAFFATVITNFLLKFEQELVDQSIPEMSEVSTSFPFIHSLLNISIENQTFLLECA